MHKATRPLTKRQSLYTETSESSLQMNQVYHNTCLIPDSFHISIFIFFFRSEHKCSKTKGGEGGQLGEISEETEK